MLTVDSWYANLMRHLWFDIRSVECSAHRSLAVFWLCSLGLCDLRAVRTGFGILTWAGPCFALLQLSATCIPWEPSSSSPGTQRLAWSRRSGESGLLWGFASPRAGSSCDALLDELRSLRSSCMMRPTYTKTWGVTFRGLSLILKQVLSTYYLRRTSWSPHRQGKELVAKVSHGTQVITWKLLDLSAS